MGWSGAGFGTFGVGTFWYVWRDGERERESLCACTRACRCDFDEGAFSMLI